MIDIDFYIWRYQDLVSLAVRFGSPPVFPTFVFDYSNVQRQQKLSFLLRSEKLLSELNACPKAY